MIVEKIIPRLTTHIVTQKVTLDLKNHVNQIQSEILQLQQKNKFQSVISFNFVTIDWLRDSILYGKEMPPEKYKPKVEEQKQNHSQTNKVVVKKNLFDSALFQIDEESYPDKDKRDAIAKTIQ